jgi:hypothetical protein
MNVAVLEGIFMMTKPGWQLVAAWQAAEKLMQCQKDKVYNVFAAAAAAALLHTQHNSTTAERHWYHHHQGCGSPANACTDLIPVCIMHMMCWFDL